MNSRAQNQTHAREVQQSRTDIGQLVSTAVRTQITCTTFSRYSGKDEVMPEENVVMYDSPEAASIQTVTGWVGVRPAERDDPPV